MTTRKKSANTNLAKAEAEAEKARLKAFDWYCDCIHSLKWSMDDATPSLSAGLVLDVTRQKKGLDADNNYVRLLSRFAKWYWYASEEAKAVKVKCLPPSPLGDYALVSESTRYFDSQKIFPLIIGGIVKNEQIVTFGSLSDLIESVVCTLETTCLVLGLGEGAVDNIGVKK